MYHNFMSINVMSFKTGYGDSVGHKVSLGLSSAGKLGAEAAV